MDVMDAGVFVSKWEAKAPKHTKVTLWGPLAAKEMGLEGWEVQDGGETGFVMHNPAVKLTMGRATSTLIFVRRLERAFLTVYFGGYPADAPAGQRKLDMQKVITQAELFLTRIAKEPVKFEVQGELALVDNTDAPTPRKGKANAQSAEQKALGGGKLGKAGRGDIIDADEELARERSALVPPEHRRKAKAARGDEDDATDDGEDAVDALARKAGYVSAKDAKARATRGKAIDVEIVEKGDTAGKAKTKGKSDVWEV
jgi:hypothetical protein